MDHTGRRGEENNAEGAVLFRVTATDQDDGDNGRIDYSINHEVTTTIPN